MTLQDFPIKECLTDNSNTFVRHIQSSEVASGY